jgi:RecA/RadA recombinase
MSKNKEFNLENYSDTEVKEDVVYKPDVDIVLQKEISDAIGMPGIRMGTVSAMYGLSNSGKTTLLIHMAAQAQKQNVVPILIITENKMDWNRAEKMGFDTSKSKCIIREDFEYLEDVYDYISQKIEDVKTGRLPKDVLILWDSVASTPSRESVEIDKTGSIKKKYGPQKSASVIGYYNPIIMKRVTSTRREDSKGLVGVVMLTQAYVKPAEFAGGIATIVPNGGEKIWFPLSLCLEIKEGMPLQATHNGRKITFGSVCKIKVAKNHLTSTSTNGEFVITADAIIANDPNTIAAYKKRAKDNWGESDVEIGEELYEELSTNYK